MKTMIAVVLSLALTMAGCANMNKAQNGAAGGAAGGALIGQMIGHNTEATLIGAAVGTMLGYIVGNEMDKLDAQQVSAVAETVPSGQAVSWRNPDNGRQMTAVPGQAYTSPRGLCRPMTIQGTVPGRSPETAQVTVCRRINPSTLEAEWMVQQ